MSEYSNLGERIKGIRQKEGLSQLEFSKTIGATKSAVSNWENGYNAPNNERLKIIADIGNISMDELLYGSVREKVQNTLLSAVDVENNSFDEDLYAFIIEYLIKHENLDDMIVAIENSNNPNLYTDEFEQDAVISFVTKHLNIFIDKFDINISQQSNLIINDFHTYVNNIMEFNLESFEDVKQYIFNVLEQIDPYFYTKDTIDEFLENDKYRELTGRTLKNRIDRFYISKLYSKIQEDLNEVIEEYYNTILNKVDENDLDK